jgi:hypothetical protein
LLALLGGATIVVVSRLRVKERNNYREDKSFKSIFIVDVKNFPVFYRMLKVLTECKISYHLVKKKAN